jgi:hypothetical protein
LSGTVLDYSAEGREERREGEKARMKKRRLASKFTGWTVIVLGER